MTGYQIKLPKFEGPFDLLLFFIERDELDIYDIPIAKITDDFLDYVHQMEALNIELASDFILTASTLMRVKARMLLPRRTEGVGQEGDDPREELTRRLVEYKRFKSVEGELRDLEENRSKKFSRGNIDEDISRITEIHGQHTELHNLSLFNLLKSFNKVLDRFEQEADQTPHTIIKYPYTIEMQKEFLTDIVAKNESTSFQRIFVDCENKIQAIFTFLALLELLQQHVVTIKSGVGYNNFWLEMK